MAPERWLVLIVRARPGGREGVVADALLGLGARSVEERAGACITHLPPPEDTEAFLERVRERLRRLEGVREVRVSWGWQRHEDWAETWKRGLGPRRVTERLVVTPSWCEPETGPGDRVLRLDPGVAFGTAGHATTRGCLRLLDEVVREGDRWLDAGAGSGILSIAAALVGGGEVVAVDADPLACESVKENAARNGVADRIRVVEARLDAASLARHGPVDGVVANIRTGVLVELLPGAARALEPGGWLVLGGIREEERSRILPAARSASFSLDGERHERGWWTGRFRLGTRRDAAGRPAPPAEGGSNG